MNRTLHRHFKTCRECEKDFITTAKSGKFCEDCLKKRNQEWRFKYATKV